MLVLGEMTDPSQAMVKFVFAGSCRGSSRRYEETVRLAGRTNALCPGDATQRRRRRHRRRRRGRVTRPHRPTRLVLWHPILSTVRDGGRIGCRTCGLAVPLRFSARDTSIPTRGVLTSKNCVQVIQKAVRLFEARGLVMNAWQYLSALPPPHNGRACSSPIWICPQAAEILHHYGGE